MVIKKNNAFYISLNNQMNYFKYIFCNFLTLLNRLQLCTTWSTSVTPDKMAEDGEIDIEGDFEFKLE